MKKHFILTALSAIILSTSVDAVATQQAQPVQATTWYVHHYPYFVTHKVRLTKNVTFKKFRFVIPDYKSYVAATKHLKKGSIVKVRKGGASYPWFVTGHGMKYTSHYGWTVLNQKNWFTTNLKTKVAKPKKSSSDDGMLVVIDD